MTIFHIALREDWESAVARGAPYAVSTRGRTLEDVGFVHASLEHQVAGIANLFYRDCEKPLCVLVIDEKRLDVPVVYEKAAGGSERFPHVYGPLDQAAVTEVLPLRADADGTYAFGWSS